MREGLTWVRFEERAKIETSSRRRVHEQVLALERLTVSHRVRIRLRTAGGWLSRRRSPHPGSPRQGRRPQCARRHGRCVRSIDPSSNRSADCRPSPWSDWIRSGVGRDVPSQDRELVRTTTVPRPVRPTLTAPFDRSESAPTDSGRSLRDPLQCPALASACPFGVLRASNGLRRVSSTSPERPPHPL
jgi:hypothetical protein